MKHHLLVELRVQHAGYPDGVCADTLVRPSEWQETGARALERHRLSVKPLPGGLDVVGGTDERGRPTVDFDALSLSFDLSVKSADFALRTDQTPFEGITAPTWRRHRTDSVLRLRSGTKPLPPGVRASVELTGVSASWLRRPRRFVIALAPRPASWVYYLLTQHAGEPPRIVDRDPVRGLQFSSELLTEGNAASDPVAQGLLRRKGSRVCYRLASARVLAAEPLAGLSLHQGPRELISALPNPSFRQHSRLLLAADPVPRDALYCVLED
jgi:hypothetical protein